LSSTRSVQTRQNTFTAHARGECDGTGQHADHHRHGHADLLANIGDCQVLVSRGMGPRLVADLRDRGVRPFLCDAEDVEQAAQQFAAGQLQEIQGSATCRHHRRG
jgi:predicted Fe-Mo cluster-binding NifX family protein